MNLKQGEQGTAYSVVSINLDSAVKRRLEMLGMTKGTKITILNNKKSGSVIVKFRGSRFALGKKFAEGIELGGE